MATMRVKAKLDNKNYKNSVKQMQKENRRFGGGLKKIGTAMKSAFAVAAVFAMVRAISRAVMSLIEYGSELSDLSAQTGVAVEKLEKLNDAALNAGSSAEKMTKALVSLKDAQGEVLDGDQLMTDAFKNLGLSVDEVAGMEIEELFVAVSKALTDSGNSAKELSAVFDVLGKRNAMELTEAMNEVADGIDGVKSAYISLDDETATFLDVYADRMARVRKEAKTLGAMLVAVIFQTKGDEKELERRMAATAAAKVRGAEQRALNLSILKGKDEEKRLKAVEKIRMAEEKIAEARLKAISDIRKSVLINIQTNSLRRIGGFAGAKVSDQLQQSRKQTEIQARIEDYTSSLPAIEKNTADKGLA